MGEKEGYRNKKSDVTSLGIKLKLHLLVYIIDTPPPYNVFFLFFFFFFFVTVHIDIPIKPI
jgi:hypothetical protein